MCVCVCVLATATARCGMLQIIYVCVCSGLHARLCACSVNVLVPQRLCVFKMYLLCFSLSSKSDFQA